MPDRGLHRLVPASYRVIRVILLLSKSISALCPASRLRGRFFMAISIEPTSSFSLSGERDDINAATRISRDCTSASRSFSAASF